MSEATCKGDWLLGTACGECSRCQETALVAAREFQKDKRAARGISLDEVRSMVRSARECAEDLQAEIDARYPEAQREEQPTSMRRWSRDSAVAVTLLDHVIRFEAKL